MAGTSTRTGVTEFSELPSGARGLPGTRAPGRRRLAAGRGRPRAAKRRGGRRAASVRRWAAAARAGWERAARGRGAAGTGGSQEPTQTAGTRRRRGALPDSRPAQPATHPDSRWRPRPQRPRAPGARCPGRRWCSWPRCCPSSARRGLQVRAARAGPPGSLRASSPLLCPPPATTHPVCRPGDRRPALCWLRVVSLTWASSSLAGQGRGIWALGAPRAGRGSGDTPGTRGPQCPRFQL